MKKSVLMVVTGAVAVSSMAGITPSIVEASNDTTVTSPSLDSDVTLLSETKEKYKKFLGEQTTSALDTFKESLHADINKSIVLEEGVQEKLFQKMNKIVTVKEKLTASTELTETELYDLRLEISEQMNTIFNLKGIPLTMLLQLDSLYTLYYNIVDSLVKGEATETLKQQVDNKGYEQSKQAFEVLTTYGVNTDSLKELFTELHITSASYHTDRVNDVIIEGSITLEDPTATTTISIGDIEKELDLDIVDNLGTFSVNLGKYTDVKNIVDIKELGTITIENGSKAYTTDRSVLVNQLSTLVPILTERGITEGLTESESLQLATDFVTLQSTTAEELSQKIVDFKTKIPKNNLNVEALYTDLLLYVTDYALAIVEKQTPTPAVPLNEVPVVEEEGTTDLDMGANNTQDTAGNIGYTHPKLEDSVVAGVKNPYTDMDRSFSKNEAIILHYAEGGLIKGVGNGKFNPSGKVTRGALATVLARVSNYSTQEGATYLADDIKGKWNAGHIQAMLENGIMTNAKTMWLTEGTSVVSDKQSSTFLPEGAVTRKELAVALKRYIEAQGVPVDGLDVSLTSFKDVTDGSVDLTQEEIEAIVLMETLGIFHGYENKFDPKGVATRAQLAKVIYNTLELVGYIDTYSIVASQTTG